MNTVSNFHNSSSSLPFHQSNLLTQTSGSSNAKKKPYTKQSIWHYSWVQLLDQDKDTPSYDQGKRVPPCTASGEDGSMEILWGLHQVQQLLTELSRTPTALLMEIMDQ